MRRTIWTPTLSWLAAVSVALALALAAPSETNVMGRLPTLFAKRLDQQQVVLPHQLPAERTLALVAFTRHQRAEIDSWIQGLRLDQDTSIPWFRMSVVNDPGSESARTAIENKLLARHPSESERSRLVPVFTDRQAFARAAGISGTERASILVLDRQGKVLARAEGKYDEAKAQALRETLLARND
ncbi:hypothetical protein GCM10027034_42160 [Ramlibacter solisilvae]|uniref:Uncharacterized protein n=1 Tax=Ramlibacter tataouinensis TaxID=94132 RepID=A0A127JZM9_9BURK|nr:hypothetical protein [Ramlibacter tataouinensis]AMO25379.1 hypothetical protein UC35_10795 [Ramlibacter tataouinensis]